MMVSINVGGVKQRQKFPQKVIVWLVTCSEDVISLVVLDGRAVDHITYVEKVLFVAVKYGNEAFGSDRIF